MLVEMIVSLMSSKDLYSPTVLSNKSLFPTGRLPAGTLMFAETIHFWTSGIETP
ncbi:hypothetical protein LEP1GSC198_1343 [Leptospira kirschneri str. JB]|nr:hypothetical protein LEP1GSC198_1343 [Leptospira kirschneri str. JB]